MRGRIIVRMNTATAKLIFAALRELYRRDRANVYTLPRDCRFLLKAVTPPWDGPLFRFDPLAAGTQVTLKAYTRDKDGSVICDGASLAPDTPRGVDAGFALHDPGYEELDAIAAAWADEPFRPGPNLVRDWLARRDSRGSDTWTPADVRLLFDAIFADAADEGGGWAGVVKLYYNAVRYLGGIFHTSGKLLKGAAPLLLCAMLSGCSGCLNWSDIADWPEGLPVPEKEEPAAPGGGTVETPPPAQPPAAVDNPDAVDFAKLEWKWGGFNGANATRSTPRLSSLRSNGSRLFYKWDVGLSGWGLGHGDAGAVCAVFFETAPGVWQGGKFDWVSTSRSDRELKHVESYSNWPSSGIKLPWRGKVAFVVVSADGRKRSNVVAAEGL